MSDELKEELQQPETEVEQNKVEEVDKLLSNEEMIEKPQDGDLPYEQVIEEGRLAFTKKYKDGRRNSYIAMGVVVALAIMAVIFIGFNQMGFKIAGWSTIGVAVVGMIVFYIVTRNQLPSATKEYIALVNNELNKRNFSDTKFSDVYTDKNEKLEASENISDNIYLNITNIASRNVINGKFAGRTFKVGDCGLYSGAGKNRTSLFVGKYVSYPNDLHFENRYILVLKGSSAVDQPNDMADLKLLSDDDGLLIYGKENAKPNADLGKDFISAIKKISVDNHLLNANFVIWSGHCSAYLSYDDPIMTLPFEKEFNKEPNEQYAHNLLAVLSAFELTIKKE